MSAIFALILESFVTLKLESVPRVLAEFRHNRIVQSPHENYFNVCRQHKKGDLLKMTIIQTGQ